MQSVREIAKKLVAEMSNHPLDCDPEAGNHFKRLAIIDYASFLRLSPYRSAPVNLQHLEQSYCYAERAIKAGVSEERIEQTFYNLRRYWTPRLGSKDGD